MVLPPTIPVTNKHTKETSIINSNSMKTFDSSCLIKLCAAGSKRGDLLNPSKNELFNKKKQEEALLLSNINMNTKDGPSQVASLPRLRPKKKKMMIQKTEIYKEDFLEEEEEEKEEEDFFNNNACDMTFAINYLKKQSKFTERTDQYCSEILNNISLIPDNKIGYIESLKGMCIFYNVIQQCFWAVDYIFI